MQRRERRFDTDEIGLHAKKSYFDHEFGNGEGRVRISAKNREDQRPEWPLATK